MGLDERFFERMAEREAVRRPSYIADEEMHAEFMADMVAYGKTVADLASEAGLNFDIPVSARVPSMSRWRRSQQVRIGGWSLTVDRAWDAPHGNDYHEGYWDSGVLLMRDGTFRDYKQHIGAWPTITAAEAKEVRISPVTETSGLLTNLADFTVRNGLAEVPVAYAELA